MEHFARQWHLATPKSESTSQYDDLRQFFEDPLKVIKINNINHSHSH